MLRNKLRFRAGLLPTDSHTKPPSTRQNLQEKAKFRGLPIKKSKGQYFTNKELQSQISAYDAQNTNSPSLTSIDNTLNTQHTIQDNPSSDTITHDDTTSLSHKLPHVPKLRNKNFPSKRKKLSKYHAKLKQKQIKNT